MTIDTLLNIGNLRKSAKMVHKKFFGVFLLGILILLPLVIAAPSFTFKQYEETQLKISCFDTNKSLCSSSNNCYVTIQYPDLTTDLVKNQTMTYQSDYWNTTLPSLNATGIYPVVARCSGSENAFSTFTFEVTPTGRPAYSILDNPVLILFGIMALVLIFMGAYFGTPWFGFIGAIMFLMGGIYTMIFGFNNVTDLYSQSFGLVYIGLGFIFMFIAAYEWIWGGRE